MAAGVTSSGLHCRSKLSSDRDSLAPYLIEYQLFGVGCCCIWRVRREISLSIPCIRCLFLFFFLLARWVWPLSSSKASLPSNLPSQDRAKSFSRCLISWTAFLFLFFFFFGSLLLSFLQFFFFLWHSLGYRTLPWKGDNELGEEREIMVRAFMISPSLGPLLPLLHPSRLTRR